jgi:hypothetical protein
MIIPYSSLSTVFGSQRYQHGVANQKPMGKGESAHMSHHLASYSISSFWVLRKYFSRLPDHERDSPHNFLLDGVTQDVSKQSHIFVPTRSRERSGPWIDGYTDPLPSITFLPNGSERFLASCSKSIGSGPFSTVDGGFLLRRGLNVLQRTS